MITQLLQFVADVSPVMITTFTTLPIQISQVKMFHQPVKIKKKNTPIKNLLGDLLSPTIWGGVSELSEPISSPESKATCHCICRLQAVMAALKLMTSGEMPRRGICWSSIKAPFRELLVQNPMDSTKKIHPAKSICFWCTTFLLRFLDPNLRETTALDIESNLTYENLMDVYVHIRLDVVNMYLMLHICIYTIHSIHIAVQFHILRTYKFGL